MSVTRRSPELVIKRFDPEDSEVLGILKTAKKAGDEVLETDLGPADAPEGRRVVTEVVKHWFPNVAPTLSVPRPAGYLIPAAKRGRRQDAPRPRHRGRGLREGRDHRGRRL